MPNEPIDIIIPVWNRPIETRACLVSLVQNSSNARLILVDNSSDRETERMLEEFAEALDVRVLYLKNRVNEGFVRAVNRGLSCSETEYVAIVRQNSVVRPGWLDVLSGFLSQAPGTGIVVPHFLEKGGKKSFRVNEAPSEAMEISAADFAALLLRRSLLDSVGSFNEEMDGAFWCLLDYSCRTWRAGYRTCVVPKSVVERSAEVTLGSESRRAEHEQKIRTTFSKTWGDARAFCIHIPKGSDLTLAKDRFDLIATAARQGNRIMLVVHPSMATPLAKAGLRRFHENISIQTLSRLLPERSAVRTVAAFIEHGLPITQVSWGAEICCNNYGEPVAFSELEKLVNANQSTYYQRTIPH
ncbi:glycosyltransferase [Geobacter pelophilus]|uniref:Glycosyltransferase n=1 Tax=Geoanaerobacter pelophilus TaxID=60036 RepID=A0AAW4KWQ1_9BACT|nr:glycosyltransferase [Geoanaerobacter pelophilus]MBT0662968.1 glycosyltransferase [Geoanaerobacter pelophilus]